MNIPGILTKAAGLTGLLLIGYDAHTRGQLRAEEKPKALKANALTKHFMDDLTLESSSIVKSKIKKGIFHYSMDENISGFFQAVSGYVSGFTSMLVHHAVPLGLVVGALVTKGKKDFCTNKVFGLGLAIYGGAALAQEIFGIGKDHH